MNLTRRLFSALIPAAPAGAMVARSGLGSSYPPIAPPPTVATYPFKELGAQMVRTAAPPAYKKYLEAQEALYKANHYRSRLMEFQRYSDRINYNIESLKSVSRQHKAHMQIKRIDDERKQEQSFMNALAESLGLKEYLEKRNRLDQYGDANEKVAVESSRW
jgi:hypothetical protein